MCVTVSWVCARLRSRVHDWNSVVPYLRDCLGKCLRIMLSVQTDVYVWVTDTVGIMFTCTENGR